MIKFEFEGFDENEIVKATLEAAEKDFTKKLSKAGITGVTLKVKEEKSEMVLSISGPDKDAVEKAKALFSD